MGSITKRFIDDEIGRSLTRHNVATSGRVKAEIERCVQLNGTSISICDGNRVMRLDDFIDQLRHNPEFSDEFPPEPLRISRNDVAKLRQHFDEIRQGKMTVE
jgi:hypothetical protein